MSIRPLVIASVTLLVAVPAAAGQVSFDVPSSIECREVKLEGFSESHPTLKVIEARFRISARVVSGDADDIVDFLYVLTSDDQTVRFQDYLPNTLLESTVVDDLIEITDNSESATNGGAQAHVAYKIFDLGASLNHTVKDSECSKYTQIAPKELVLASGTTNREHGVFFRLRPSLAASLEGAKEFTFLATVPRTWRGDLCTIACRARVKKSSLIASAIVPGGLMRAQVGMYLAGDVEAARLAEDLRRVQDSLASLSARAARQNPLDAFSSHAVGLFTGKKSETKWRDRREEAEQALLDVRGRLTGMAR